MLTSGPNMRDENPTIGCAAGQSGFGECLRGVNGLLAAAATAGLLLSICGLAVSLSARAGARRMAIRVEGHLIKVGAVQSDVRAVVAGCRNQTSTLGREISKLRADIERIAQSGGDVGGKKHAPDAR